MGVRAAAQAKPRPIGQMVGERIAGLRREKSLTLEALASGTGLTPSYLSRLERGQTSISVDNLRNVAHFLGVEMVHFFDRLERSDAILTKKGGGTPLAIANTNAYGEALITTTQSSLQATLYHTPAGQGRSFGFSHPGEEFVLVVRGRVRYRVGSDDFVLQVGDSLWHRSSEPHGWKNLGKVTAITLHVNSPPVW